MCVCIPNMAGMWQQWHRKWKQKDFKCKPQHRTSPAYTEGQPPLSLFITTPSKIGPASSKWLTLFRRQSGYLSAHSWHSDVSSQKMDCLITDYQKLWHCAILSWPHSILLHSWQKRKLTRRQPKQLLLSSVWVANAQM